MKICIIIGTRPQYIKLKPLYDYFKGKKVDFCVVDTGQHYSSNVSNVFIQEFGISIDYNLQIKGNTEIEFLSDAIKRIEEELLLFIKPDCVLVLGDTNSTLASSLVANKLKIKLGHIEAGIRCGSRSRPEEINRILVDDLADVHFISRKKDKVNVKNPIFIGDLEYSFLNKYYNDVKILYGDFLLMTIHRQENVIKNVLINILKECGKSKYNIIFPIHHRTKNLIEQENLEIPPNITLIEPCGYSRIIELLSSCSGVISDSGGLTKICPFFGKKCIIPGDFIEWDDLISSGYGKMGLDFSFFNEFRMDRNKNMYFVEDSCDKILNTCYKFFDNSVL